MPQNCFFFFKKHLAQKRLSFSICDCYRFNERARNLLISSKKVLISTSIFKKALIITFLPNNAH